MAFARARGILPTLQSVFNVHGDNRPEDRDNEKAWGIRLTFETRCRSILREKWSADACKR